MICDPVFLQVIKNIRAAIHAAGLKRALFFAEIVEGYMFKRNVVEIEIPPEVQLCLDEFGEPATEDAPAGNGSRQPSKRPQPFKRGVGRVVNEITPIAMVIGPSAGEDGWDTGGTVAKDGSQSLAPRGEVPAKGIVFYYLPSTSINKHEER